MCAGNEVVYSRIRLELAAVCADAFEDLLDLVEEADVVDALGKLETERRTGLLSFVYMHMGGAKQQRLPSRCCRRERVAPFLQRGETLTSRCPKCPGHSAIPSAHVSHLKFLSIVPSRVSERPPTLGLCDPSSNVSGYSIRATERPLISSGLRMPNWIVFTRRSGALE